MCVRLGDGGSWREGADLGFGFISEGLVAVGFGRLGRGGAGGSGDGRAYGGIPPAGGAEGGADAGGPRGRDRAAERRERPHLRTKKWMSASYLVLLPMDAVWERPVKTRG